MEVKFYKAQIISRVKHYFTTTSFVKIIEAFKETCVNVHAPNKKRIYRYVTRYQETGSVRDNKRSGHLLLLNSDKTEDINNNML